MTTATPNTISPLRQRMINDMVSRGLVPQTQKGHVRACKRFAAYLKRSPELATAEDVRLFQLHLIESGLTIQNRNRTMTGVRFQNGGVEALDDKPSKPSRVWNRIPDDIRAALVAMALDEPELSPRELAARFTDTQKYFVSEASVYRLLKAHEYRPTRSLCESVAGGASERCLVVPDL